MKDNNDFNKNIGGETEKIELQNENTEKLIKDDIINGELNGSEKTADERKLDNEQIENTTEKSELIYDPEVEKKYTESKGRGSEGKGKRRKNNMNNNIKSNYKEKSFMTSITAIIVMLVMAIGIVSCYPAIKNVVKEDVIESPYQNYELLRGIYETSYVLNKDVIDAVNGADNQWDEIYLNPESKEIDGYHQIRNGLYKELNHFQMNLQNNFKNLDYSVLDSSGNNVTANRNNNLADIINKNDEESIQSLQDYYGFYMVVRYDNDGYANVEKVYGADDYRVRNIFSEFTFGDYYNEIHDDYNRESSSVATSEMIELNPIKNTTFVYGIPNELAYADKISNIVNYQLNGVNIVRIVMITLCILLGILILGLFIPYKAGRKISGINLISRIPLEINFIIFGVLAWACGIGGFAAITATIQELFQNDFLVRFGIDMTLSNTTIGFINVIVWTLIIYIIFLGDMLLKHIFTSGLIKYLKEKSIFFKCLRLVKRLFEKAIHNIYRAYEYVVEIDLSEKSNKSLIKILGANLLVMIGCCLFWRFGIFIAAAYTILVFYLSRKHYEKIKNNFQTLLNASNEMSDGNLDINIEEDLGMFNPLKDSLQEIQSGFRKAVNEEVKSQRMKTELISNVSHDLKTPLTSIITYVDLLKNENITEEERKSYIDTLDKKSQRLKFLIEDLFEVSKATSGNIQLHLVNVDIVELVRQIEIELDDKLKKSDLIIKNNFPKNKVILELDSQKTFRIFENLLNNVSKYAMTGSRVYIDIEDSDSDVKITIKNISAVEIDFTADEIIERFQRGDKSRNTEGSGLGLAIAKSFVEIQGGSFTVETDGDLFKVIIVFKK